MRGARLSGFADRTSTLEQKRLAVEQTLLAPRYVLTQTVAILRAHRRRQAEEQIPAGSAYAQSDLVFRREDGSPVIPHLFTLAFHKVVAAAELPEIRLHDLRHTHVALLARAGVPAKVIRERVGHHSAGITLDNYGGTFASQHAEAAQRLAQLVSRSGSSGKPSPGAPVP